MTTQPRPTKRPQSRQQSRVETERAILNAAETVFAEAGFGGATMQLIADMAGLPKANLHYYFPTKEQLYRSVVQNIFEIWLDAARNFDTAPSGRPPRTQSNRSSCVGLARFKRGFLRAVAQPKDLTKQ